MSGTRNEQQNIVIVKNWDDRLMANDPEFKAEYVKAQIKFVVENVCACVNTYGPDDLLIVKRDSTFEVWTLKAFKPGELVFVPETSEIKPRFYTVGRSVIARNTADPTFNKGSRPFVIDGRVRGNPAPDSKTAFSLFWLVQRVGADAPDVNMVVKHVTCNIQASIKLGDRNMPCTWPATSLPEIPVMTNVGKLAKHTRLIVSEDQDVKALFEQQHKESLKEEDAANKENESSNKATAVGHKKPHTVVGHKRGLPNGSGEAQRKKIRWPSKRSS